MRATQVATVSLSHQSFVVGNLHAWTGLVVSMTLRGMFADENNVRCLEVLAFQKCIQRSERDSPKPACAPNERYAAGVFTEATPIERTVALFGSLGDKTSGLAGDAINLADLLSRGPVRVGRFSVTPGLPFGCDREPALRTCRGTIGDTMLTFGAVDEHSAL